MPLSRIFTSMRPKQWIKNVFVFMPLVFSGNLLFPRYVLLTSAGFALFCLAASAIYLINDIADRNQDKTHPFKSARPIASGALGGKIALISALIITTFTLLMSYFLDPLFFWIVLSYLILNVFYSLLLKNVALLDVMVVALGFEIRIWGGSLLLGVVPSSWLRLCVFLLAIFLTLIKRRSEIYVLHNDPQPPKDENPENEIYFIDQLVTISATLCIIFYGLYTVSSDLVARIGSNAMTYTIPFVVYGIFRYLLLVHRHEMGGDPGELIFSDTLFMVNLLLWGGFSFLILYIF